MTKLHRNFLEPIFIALMTSFCAVSAAVPDQPGSRELRNLVEAGETEALTEGSLTFVQISDTHMGRDRWMNRPELTSDLLKEVAELYPDAAFVVFTGDNTDGPMKLFLQAIEDAPFPVFWIPGNTDSANFLWHGRLAESVTPEDCAGPHLYHYVYHRPETPGWELHHDGTGCYSVEKDDSLFLFIDTSVFGHEGILRPDRLRWIHRTLSAAADKHVFVFAHHGDGWLLNEDRLIELLDFHRPRFRSINHVEGHTHRSRLPVRRGGVNYFDTSGTLQNGTFAVYHVHPDRIIQYTRNSMTYARRAKAEGARDTDEPPPAITGTGVHVVRSKPRQAPLGPLPPELDAWNLRLAWKGNEEPEQGDVLRVRFSPTDYWIFKDESGCGNDLYAESIYLRKKEPMPAPASHINTIDGVSGKMFGHGSGRRMMGFDTYSLNSPHKTNRITVEAGIRIPQQPLGWEGLITGKTAYLLSINEEGRGLFTLWLRTGEDRQREVTLLTPEPLPAERWLRLAGTYDGTTARLSLDGEVVAEESVPGGGTLLASTHGSLLVGGIRAGSYPSDTDHSFLISDLRISNSYRNAAERLSDRSIPAYQTERPPQVNGFVNKDEWPPRPAFVLEKAVVEGMESVALEDIRAEGFLSWDPDHLYLGVVVEDAVHEQTATGSSIPEGDMIQVFIGNEGRWLDLGLAVNHTGERVMRLWKLDFGEADDIQSAAARREGTTHYEIAFPWSVLASPEFAVGPGTTLQFRFRVWNNDGKDSETFLEFLPDRPLLLVDQPASQSASELP